MAHKHTPVVEAHEPLPSSYGSYIIGFALAVILSLAPFLIVQLQVSSGRLAYSSLTLRLIIGGFAIAQAIVQLIYFLHLGRESRPRWKLVVFSFMVAIVCIVVFGSLWIMSNLNYRMMSSPEQLNTYLHAQDGL